MNIIIVDMSYVRAPGNGSNAPKLQDLGRGFNFPKYELEISDSDPVSAVGKSISSISECYVARAT